MVLDTTIVQELRINLLSCQNVNLTRADNTYIISNNDIIILGISHQVQSSEAVIDENYCGNKVSTSKECERDSELFGLYWIFLIVHWYAINVHPLSGLLKNDTPFVFGAEQENAFNAPQEKLASTPMLNFYNPEAEIEVHTDAIRQGFVWEIRNKIRGGKKCIV